MNCTSILDSTSFFYLIHCLQVVTINPQYHQCLLQKTHLQIPFALSISAHIGSTCPRQFDSTISLQLFLLQALVAHPHSLLVDPHQMH